MTGTFVVYGVTRKLAHDTAVLELRKSAERRGQCMMWDTAEAQKALQNLEDHKYINMKPRAISPWFGSPGPAKEFIELAAAKDGGKNMRIRQKCLATDSHGTPIRSPSGKQKSELRSDLYT